jgi:hypothetical protein
VVTDVLRFSEPPVVVPDQGFGLATESSADFESASCDGIFVSALPLTPVQASGTAGRLHVQRQRSAIPHHRLRMHLGHMLRCCR